MKVLLINNYPMDVAHAEWERGECPSQHLWGTVELEKNGTIELVILKHQKYKSLDKIGSFFKISHLDQQVRVLLMIRKIDIIYAPYATSNTKLFLLFKLLRIISTPIVIAVHQPMFGFDSGNRLKKLIARKLIPVYDALIFLSNELKKEYIQQLSIPEAIAEKNFFDAEWGADSAFYKKYIVEGQALKENFAICAGRTDRDFEVIIEAFREIPFRLKIYCDNESVPQGKDLPKNIEVYPEGISYVDLLREYNEARIILIPLKKHRGGTQGLTSLIDVYAMGKPVIMTYNKSINIDIEAEGIGYWAEQNNILDWRGKINKIFNDENVFKSMCSNSQRIFREKCNTGIFAGILGEVFTTVYNRS